MDTPTRWELKGVKDGVLCSETLKSLRLQRTHLVQEGAHAEARAAQQHAEPAHEWRDKNENHGICFLKGSSDVNERSAGLFPVEQNKREVFSWAHLWKDQNRSRCFGAPRVGVDFAWVCLCLHERQSCGYFAQLDEAKAAARPRRHKTGLHSEESMTKVIALSWRSYTVWQRVNTPDRVWRVHNHSNPGIERKIWPDDKQAFCFLYFSQMSCCINDKHMAAWIINKLHN